MSHCKTHTKKNTHGVGRRYTPSRSQEAPHYKTPPKPYIETLIPPPRELRTLKLLNVTYKRPWSGETLRVIPPPGRYAILHVMYL